MQTDMTTFTFWEQPLHRDRWENGCRLPQTLASSVGIYFAVPDPSVPDTSKSPKTQLNSIGSFQEVATISGWWFPERTVLRKEDLLRQWLYNNFQASLIYGKWKERLKTKQEQNWKTKTKQNKTTTEKKNPTSNEIKARQQDKRQLKVSKPGGQEAASFRCLLVSHLTSCPGFPQGCTMIRSLPSPRWF